MAPMLQGSWLKSLFQIKFVLLSERHPIRQHWVAPPSTQSHIDLAFKRLVIAEGCGRRDGDGIVRRYNARLPLG